MHLGFCHFTNRHIPLKDPVKLSDEFWASEPQLILITTSHLQFKVETVKHPDVALNDLLHECRFNHWRVHM